MATKRTPSPRYRSDDPEPSIRLQPDDLEILWHIYCNRVIDAKSIALLFPSRSAQVISRRLNLLRKGKTPYIQRLAQAQNRIQERKGSDPLVYALANRGARALAAHRQVDLGDYRWTQKNRELRTSTIQHDVAVSRFMAQVKSEAMTKGDAVQVLYEQELDMPKLRDQDGARGLKNTIRTQIKGWYGHRGEQGTAPDRIFALRTAEKTFFYFLEIDMGTEPIAPSETRLRSPSFWRGSSVLRKMVVYSAAAKDRSTTKTHGIPRFRVIILTTTEARRQRIEDARAKHLPDTRAALFLGLTWAAPYGHLGRLRQIHDLGS